LAKYSVQLNRLYSYFPKKQFKIILFDDFKNDTAGVYGEVAEWLGVGKFSPKLEARNPNAVNRVDWLARFLRHPPKVVRQLKRFVVGRGRTRLYERLISANQIERPRQRLSDQMRNEISLEYGRDVKCLEKILERNLSSWLK